MRELRAVVLGQPVAQGRPRFMQRRAVDPVKSREWKERASLEFCLAIQRARLRQPAFEGPVELRIVAVFECPRSEHRKRTPVPRRPRDTAPDADNVAKAVMDAGTGILWHDDGQVARLVVDKVVGAQDEEPAVHVTVREVRP